MPPLVLGVAICLEAFALRTAVHEANKVRGRLPWLRYIRKTRSPELPVILLDGREHSPWVLRADLDGLPTDATELKAVLTEKVRGHESGEDNELWESITGLLRESPASPALRRALWQVAATMPDASGCRSMSIARSEGR